MYVVPFQSQDLTKLPIQLAYSKYRNSFKSDCAKYEKLIKLLQVTLPMSFFWFGSVLQFFSVNSHKLVVPNPLKTANFLCE